MILNSDYGLELVSLAWFLWCCFVPVFYTLSNNLDYAFVLSVVRVLADWLKVV